VRLGPTRVRAAAVKFGLVRRSRATSPCRRAFRSYCSELQLSSPARHPTTSPPGLRFPRPDFFPTLPFSLRLSLQLVVSSPLPSRCCSKGYSSRIGDIYSRLSAPTPVSTLAIYAEPGLLHSCQTLRILSPYKLATSYLRICLIYRRVSHELQYHIRRLAHPAQGHGQASRPRRPLAGYLARGTWLGGRLSLSTTALPSPPRLQLIIDLARSGYETSSRSFCSDQSDNAAASPRQLQG
jgi:hypothetical protein